jgi:hypothetical protein
MEAVGEEECFSGIATVYVRGPGFKIGSAKTPCSLSLLDYLWRTVTNKIVNSEVTSHTKRC